MYPYICLVDTKIKYKFRKKENICIIINYQIVLNYSEDDTIVTPNPKADSYLIKLLSRYIDTKCEN